jgi:hypothetical protein
MTSHGILMSDEMVRQYLAGRKIMTRRTRGLDVINKSPNHWTCRGLSSSGDHFVFDSLPLPDLPRQKIKPPYGYIGDELWFKECFQVIFPLPVVSTDGRVHMQEWSGRLPKTKHVNFTTVYRADDAKRFSGWRPSIFMNKWASRIVTRVRSIRVERLQDIVHHSYEAKQEGFDYLGTFDDVQWRPGVDTGKCYFIDYWDSLNAKRGMSWEFNPWVWVYEFPQYSPSPQPSPAGRGGEVDG